MRRLWIAAVIVLLVVVSASARASDSRPTMTSRTTLVGSSMPMVTPTTADSFTPKMASLASTGWTAVASDQQGNYPASYAVDGSRTTFWHSKYSPTPVPLPHSITINTHATRYISGLTYLPRQDASYNGNIGRYSISVSSDGTAWSAPVASGTWADDKSLKTAIE